MEEKHSQNMNSGYFYVCFAVLALLQIIVFFGITKDWTGSDKKFIIKKWMDIAVYILQYFLAVYLSCTFGFSEINKCSYAIAFFVFLSLFEMFLIILQLFYFDKHRTRLNSKVFPHILVSLIVGIIFSFALLNFCLYCFNNSLFTFNQNMSAFEIAIEFLYYAFTVTVTYSNSTIVATGVLSKITQMIYVALIYFVIANIIFTLIENSKNQKK